jgi:teichuronic acid biosynthesis glycosyltransferase TuaG
MSAPLVSACIGSYNRERYIRETLDSVLAQTYRPLEIVVVDDASTDRTVDIIKSYGAQVTLIQRTENSGICPVTRNQAARAAQGEYIAFLDSDDAWYPTKIEKQVAFMEAHPDVPVCHTYCHLMDEDSRITGIRHEGRLPPTGNLFRALLNHCWVTISSVMVRRGIFEEAGGYFTEDRRYGIWGEEHEFLLRVSRRHPIGLVDEVLSKYRRASQNISSGNWKCFPETVPFHDMIIDRRDIWEGIVPRSEVVASFVAASLENARAWRALGHPERAQYFALGALRRDPASVQAVGELLKSTVRRWVPRASKGAS